MKKLLLILVLTNLFLPFCFSATQLKKVVAPAGGDYTTLEACMAGNEQDLVTNDKYFDVEISGDWSGGADATQVSIDTYTTDVTRYINIYVVSASIHGGVWDANKYRLVLDPGWSSPCLSVSSNHVTIKGIQINHTGGGSAGNCLKIQTSTDYVNVTHCIFKGASGDNAYSESDNDHGYFYNCISYDATSEGFYFEDIDWVANLTAIDNGRHGIAFFYSADGYNLLCSHNTGDDLKALSTGNTNNLYNCASEDATANSADFDVTDACNDTINTANLYNDYANDDFSLQSGTTVDVVNAGTDRSVDFTDDIGGTTRTGTWDIGADEYVAAGGASAAQFIMINP